MKKLLSLLFLSMPLVASANVVWPSLYIVSQVYCWYIIVLGLIVEFFAVRFFWRCHMAEVGRDSRCHECCFCIGGAGADSGERTLYGGTAISVCGCHLPFVALDIRLRVGRLGQYLYRRIVHEMDFQIPVQTHFLVAFCCQCCQRGFLGVGAFIRLVRALCHPSTVLAEANIFCRGGIS